VNNEKYIGLDVHQATISVAVMDSAGKLVMESILETKAATILQFFAGLRGTLWVTFEEGTCATWLYDLLNPHVAKLVVCNPRKNALLKSGNKSDRIDARKLAELLRGNHLKPVYHGETSVRTLRELARSYVTTVKDLTRVMSRLKALYRSWAIPCAGRDVYYTRHWSEWLGKIEHVGVRRRAEQLYQHLDVLQQLRRQVRRELLAESGKHPATAKLRQIPYLGARFDQRCSWLSSRRRIASARNANCGPTAGWHWRLVPVRNTAMSKANYGTPRSNSPSGVSTRTTTMI
jgi:hypothetical protein